jgi:uncharacterized protein (DUF427 family)
MTERRSLYDRHPDYRVDLEPSARRVRVLAGGEPIADTTRSLIVRETRHEPVVYVPLADVRADVVERTSHTTFCPFKGDASYWTVRVGGVVLENVMWGYEKPFDEVAGLAGFVAFYPDRVEWQQDDDEDA